MNRRYFTLRGAQELVRIMPQNLSDEQLQKYIVKLRDFKSYIDYSDIKRLIDGGYFDGIIDSSATGLVPKDIWLQTNLGSSLDEAITERDKRLQNHPVLSS